MAKWCRRIKLWRKDAACLSVSETFEESCHDMYLLTKISSFTTAKTWYFLILRSFLTALYHTYAVYRPELCVCWWDAPDMTSSSSISLRPFLKSSSMFSICVPAFLKWELHQAVKVWEGDGREGYTVTCLTMWQVHSHSATAGTITLSTICTRKKHPVTTTHSYTQLPWWEQGQLSTSVCNPVVSPTADAESAEMYSDISVWQPLLTQRS